MERKFFGRTNLMGFILKVAGVVVIVWGFIYGVAILVEYAAEFGDISVIDALTTLFKPTLIGLLIIGFGEVIDLLQELADKGKPKDVENANTSEAPGVQGIQNVQKVYAEMEIKNYYKNKNMEVGAIHGTNKSDIFSVEVDGKTEYIELSGFKPRVLTDAEVEKLN
ncbi:hypothetical protein JSQ81_11815 [Sporosarcina sp. Marseille-Q4063]|uniref:hypothetical protein n=1 Tax=Sporosarcina sp. Marseille-Q4063 TaxID=2810514 RepID=UPI001BAEAFEB|nr:hypothetical protein [Sporosarcina sp. Marseille-Q4063]QUW20545.1 hypothetical protein JSQ81_11815 [Sporosarcina sp. Marseille-Q4063]